MVDVSPKSPTKREAEASAFVALKPAVLKAMPQNPKGHFAVSVSMCSYCFTFRLVICWDIGSYRVVLEHRASRDYGSDGAGNFVVIQGILRLACNCLEYSPRQRR
jgi:MoaC family